MSDSAWLSSSLHHHFGLIDDPRVQGRCAHRLVDIIVIALLAVLAGATGWEEIATYGQGKQTWLSTFLELPNGIPSHDTFRRVLAQLDPDELEARFQDWMGSLLDQIGGTLIAIDGKTVKGSYDRQNQIKALQMVSAWSTAHRLVLAQTPVSGKSNEITAIPVLLEQLHVRGTIISIDAMGTHRRIAQQIHAAGADYILALKGNQGFLHKTAVAWFEDQERQQLETEVLQDHYLGVDSGHHRIETRQVWVFRAADVFPAAVCADWSGLQSLVVVRSRRQLWNQTTCETRFFLSSLSEKAVAFAQWIRAHWEIENCLHWCLDVVFGEDASRIRTQNAARNLSILRRLALNLVRQHPGKGSLKMKRYRASLDNDFLMEILAYSLPHTLPHSLS
ncbi:MAG TPA: ISAs1 family transposase [Oscillatoriaceae cyanobacterium M33_DOE_052]|nr:ISAs1 family transposase [Oscillatoriaceae cyanobacterium M33_DOE_052]